MTRFTVHTYDDLDGANLSDRGKERVLRELATGEHTIVVWLEAWLFGEEDKEFETLPETRRLCPAHEVVESNSGKAWGIIQEENGNPEWAPKSCSEVYERDPNRGTKPQTSPQKGLSEFGGTT